MEPKVSMSHSKGFSSNPYLSQIYPVPRIDTFSSRSILILSFYLRLDISMGLFPVGLQVKILKALLWNVSVKIRVFMCAFHRVSSFSSRISSFFTYYQE